MSAAPAREALDTLRRVLAWPVPQGTVRGYVLPTWLAFEAEAALDSLGSLVAVVERQAEALRKIELQALSAETFIRDHDRHRAIECCSRIAALAAPPAPDRQA